MISSAAVAAAGGAGWMRGAALAKPQSGHNHARRATFVILRPGRRGAITRPSSLPTG
jgi:hypothetical protein